MPMINACRLPIALATTLVLAGPAFAHAHLTAAKPAAGGTVAASPAELDLTFSEGLNLTFSGVTITGPAHAAIATGPATLSPGEGTTLKVPVPATLPPGTYAVAWHALSTDGHKTSGRYTFTVAP